MILMNNEDGRETGRLSRQLHSHKHSMLSRTNQQCFACQHECITDAINLMQTCEEQNKKSKTGSMEWEGE